jgi:flavin-dependent dehydrogenase
MFATALAQAGVNVDLFEEHRRVGFPEHCTGLISRATEEMIGGPALKSELGVIESFVISGPRLSLRLRASQPIVKLNRVRLEELMLEGAEAEGVKFIDGVKTRPLPDGTVLPLGKSYDVVILAEGFNGTARRQLGIGFNGEVIYGVNAEAEDGGSPDFEAKFDETTSDGFFSWRVTLRSVSVVGTASRRPSVLAAKLREAMKAHNVEGDIVKTYGGPIITGPPSDKVRLGRVVVVGDAASMNKPLTGGGLYPSAAASRMAQRMIAKGISVADALEASVKSVNRGLRRSYHVSKLLHSRPEAVDLLVYAATSSGLAEEVSGKVDYDIHFSLFRESARSWRAYYGALRALVRSPANSLRLLASLITDII